MFALLLGLMTSVPLLVCQIPSLSTMFVYTEDMYMFTLYVLLKALPPVCMKYTAHQVAIIA